MVGNPSKAMKIKNLLFDLGGVIMEIRRADCIQAFRDLGMEHPEAFLGEYVQAGPFQGIENGSMTPADFHDALRPYLATGTTDGEIDAAFQKFLIGIPSHRLEELKKLRAEGYKVYMLSNTNPIMWNGKIADEFSRDGREGIDAYFDGVVTSFVAKVMKPSADIFDYACKKLDIKPEETLFFDDSQENIEAAKRLGFEGVTVKPGDEFSILLKEYTKN